MTSTNIPPTDPEDNCPDCDAPAGRFCFPWCLRFAEDAEDLAFELEQAGGHPDGF